MLIAASRDCYVEREEEGEETDSSSGKREGGGLRGGEYNSPSLSFQCFFSWWELSLSYWQTD